MRYVRDNIACLEGYTPGFQPKEADFIKLNTNENPYPPSPLSIKAMKAACEESIRKYPPPLADDFRDAASTVLHVKPEEIICGFGSDDILTIAVRTFCDQGDPVAFTYPSYSLYEILAGIQGAQSLIVDFPEDFSLPEELKDTGAKLTLLANPNAPSGTLIKPSTIKTLAAGLAGILLVDEAYVDFASDNCLRLIRECDNLVITRTFSKAYSLAGLRFGFAIANPHLVNEMMKVKDSYNVSAPGMAGAKAAIEDQKWLKKNVDQIINTRKTLSAGLESLGFHCQPSETNFVLAEAPENTVAKELYQRLFENKILVRYFNMPRLDHCLRITVGTDKQIARLLAVLKEILNEEEM